jgi:hypothetical protein
MTSKKKTTTKDLQQGYVWAKQKMATDCAVIDCPPYDPYKHFHRDPSGHYVLIRPDFSTLTIDVAVCDKGNVIVAVFRGVTPQDIYEGIFAYEKKHGLAWFKDKTHAAYLGKELKKAQLALALGQNSYFQE